MINSIITEEERRIFYKVLRYYNKEDVYSVVCELFGEDFADNELTDEDYNTMAEMFENNHDMNIDDWSQLEGIIDTYLERPDLKQCKKR